MGTKTEFYMLSTMTNGESNLSLPPKINGEFDALNNGESNLSLLQQSMGNLMYFDWRIKIIMMMIIHLNWQIEIDIFSKVADFDLGIFEWY